MNPFDILPEDKIYELCEDLPLDALLNFSETHKRIYDICYNIIQERKKDYLEIKKINNFLEQAKFRDYYYFVAPIFPYKDEAKTTVNKMSILIGINILPKYKLIGSQIALRSFLSSLGYSLKEAKEIILTEGINNKNFRNNPEFKTLPAEIPFKYMPIPELSVARYKEELYPVLSSPEIIE